MAPTVSTKPLPVPSMEPSAVPSSSMPSSEPTFSACIPSISSTSSDTRPCYTGTGVEVTAACLANGGECCVGDRACIAFGETMTVCEGSCIGYSACNLSVLVAGGP
jgi:hypothetical protein